MADEGYKFSTLDLEVLAILANSRRPVRYMEFVNKQDRSLLCNVMDLAKFGLVRNLDVDEIRKMGYSVEELCGGQGDRDAGNFYELSENGRYVVNRMVDLLNDLGALYIK